jgi:transcriptional regulator with XRE-family HTH domain
VGDEPIAEATGYSLSAISMYEHGNRQAGYAKLLRLAELYGCSVDDFFADRPDSPQLRLQRLEARVAELELLLVERSTARQRAHDERSRIRGSEPSRYGRGRGF